MTKARSQDPYQGRYGYGVVVEITSRTRHKLPRNVSLHLYDDEGHLFIHADYVAKGLMVPSYVDFHMSELVWYRRAAEQGYHTIPNPPDWSLKQYLA